jgi:hypothetical protein
VHRILLLSGTNSTPTGSPVNPRRSRRPDASGKAERTIRLAVARGKKLKDDLSAIEGTSLDNKSDLDALARMKFYRSFSNGGSIFTTASTCPAAIK